MIWPGYALATRQQVGATHANSCIAAGIESLVVTAGAALYSGAPPGAQAGNCTGSRIPRCADRRGGKGHRDRRDEYRGGAVAGRLGVNRCGGPLMRRPHLQRGCHGDRGEPEHAAVTTATR